MIRTNFQLAEELNLCTETLIMQLSTLREKEQAVADARWTLESTRTTILITVDPKTLGANESIREAAILLKTVTERANLESLESILRAVKCAVELARLRLSAARDQLRCAELAAGVERSR